MAALRKILEHPITNVVTALVLISASLAEGWEDFTDELVRFDLGVHHGVLLYGAVMLLRGILESLEAVVRAHERRQRDSAG